MDIASTFADTNQAFSEFITLLSSINIETINTLPFEGSWTAGQVAQHVILSAGSFVQLVNGAVKPTERNPEVNVPMLQKAFLDFSTKMKSPHFIVPEAKTYNKQELVATLQQIEKALLQAINTLDATMTCTAFELPGLGYITRAEAYTFCIVHTLRHTHQLKNIKQHLLA